MTPADLRQHIAKAIEKTFDAELDLGRFSVDFADDPQFGDLTTNAAMVYAKDLKMAPREAASKLAEQIGREVKEVERVEVAGPGFINMTLTDKALGGLVLEAPKTKPDAYEGQEVVAEYSDPNPFKVLHAGHLYTSVVGDAVANLLERAGAKVHRVNFGGDVGLHVAKNMWAIVKHLGGEHPENLEDVAAGDRANWLSARYVEGNRAYEAGGPEKSEIMDMNRRVYGIHEAGDHESDLARIYWTCRGWSYDYFNAFYARLGSRFEKYYPESETSPLGVEKVQELLKQGVLEKSDGAVIFRGEEHGLHTRVFLTSQGLPTYETKDLGLLLAKWRDYNFDLSVVVTANDIVEYMKVVLKVVEQFDAKLASRSLHLTHGNVKLAGGVKMSSRLGNVMRAADILDAATEANEQMSGNKDDRVVLGAVKFAFLKSRIGPDVVFIPEESVSLEGKSGPYLQYAHARARSILAKAEGREAAGDLVSFDAGERTLARKLALYPGVLQQAVTELLPHLVCTYLYELAQVFNRFYEGNRVMGDKREPERLALVAAYADVLRDGLTLLGIEAPDRL